MSSQISIGSELVLSLRKMNKIDKIESDSGIAIAEAGCVLQQLNESVSDGGWMVPLDLGNDDYQIQNVYNNEHFGST